VTGKYLGDIVDGPKKAEIPESHCRKEGTSTKLLPWVMV
jgi:phosphoserine phosphatase